MRRFLAGYSLILSVCPCNGAEPATPGGILSQVADRYKKLTFYEIEAESETLLARGGQGVTIQIKTLLAVGPAGEFRVEQNSNGVLELRLSDGKITWKALPKQKVWSKQEVSQATTDDSDKEGPEVSSLGQDLFTQTQHSLVARYTGLARYAGSAVDEGTAQIKHDGAKTECCVLRISTPGQHEPALHRKEQPFDFAPTGAAEDERRGRRPYDDRLQDDQ